MTIKFGNSKNFITFAVNKKLNVMKKDDNNFLLGVFTLGMLVGGFFVLILAKLMLN